MSLTKRVVRTIGYGFFARFGDYRVIPGATGFGLYSREVVDTLKQWRDPEPFFRGMLVESGYSLETIPYHRPARVAGISKNNWRTTWSFALASLASCSKKLLRIPLFLSMFFLPLGAVTVVAVLILPFVGISAWSVFFAGVMLCCFALVFLFLGLLGEQVRLIAEMTRNTPLVTEKERVNFPPFE
jgi:hypothetical protein